MNELPLIAKGGIIVGIIIGWVILNKYIKKIGKLPTIEEHEERTKWTS